MSSSAEVYGAVQQEARISRAIEIMLLHVDNLKRIYEREHAELEEAKKILADHNLSVEDISSSGGGHSFHLPSSSSSPNALGVAAASSSSPSSSSGARMRSVSVIHPTGAAAAAAAAAAQASGGSSLGGGDEGTVSEDHLISAFSNAVSAWEISSAMILEKCATIKDSPKNRRASVASSSSHHHSNRQQQQQQQQHRPHLQFHLQPQFLPSQPSPAKNIPNSSSSLSPSRAGDLPTRKISIVGKVHGGAEPKKSIHRLQACRSDKGAKKVVLVLEF